ncbi:MAG: S1C family serine protease [Acidimicrobiales bacterium]
MSALDDISATISSVASKVGPSVVGVNRQGSGFVAAKGYVVTNAHNVRGESLVTFGDGRQVAAQVAGVDIDGDLAVLAVDTADLPAVEWSTTQPALGDVVVALANPRGRGLRATIGTVSSTGRGFRGPRGRRIAGNIEHTAALSRGSSGSPVLDREGRVVGVNTNRLQEGFYQALASTEELARRIAGLSKGEEPHRRRLGTALAPPHVTKRLRAAAGLPEAEGLLVRGVEEGSPAEAAGLRQGDVLVTANGQALTSVDALYEALDGEGDLELTVVRATEQVEVVVHFS